MTPHFSIYTIITPQKSIAPYSNATRESNTTSWPAEVNTHGPAYSYCKEILVYSGSACGVGYNWF